MTLVSTEWLNNNLSKVKILDASWHLLPDRNGFDEYQKKHIENAIFFDLEKNSNQQKNLPHNHFLPEKKNWEETLSKMGISNTDKVVIYDNSDLITSCRCWFQFLYFGHDSKLVFILDGGLKKWRLENKKVTNKETKIILLGIVPEHICRIQSEWKHFFEFGNIHGFKPKFYLKNNKIYLKKNPLDKKTKLVKINQIIDRCKETDRFYKEKFKKIFFNFHIFFHLLKTLNLI